MVSLVCNESMFVLNSCWVLAMQRIRVNVASPAAGTFKPGEPSPHSMTSITSRRGRRGGRVAFRIDRPQQDLRNSRSPDGLLQFAPQRHDLDRMVQMRRLQAVEPGRHRSAVTPFHV
jgi:hypothetical protein